ncbi:oxidoreductase [Novosphingobium beihaiensis]|uniref:Oxidoreductase n=1 Tax=Novosphingobium beihaiensis TaxID=2930389 RepID=A0ABT0BV02_9SPHN|nr:oxidoreductase [Novosphingobium beihaiensis]MCJ2188703.1 oxidoreductase [Novosphingobium beihaiensis]
MKTIGVGLIGYGLGGRVFHAPFVQAADGMELRAVVSSDPGKVHAQLPGMAVAESVDALLAMPGIDLVIVSSPDHLHAEHAIAALSAGKHVLVDKPFATCLADARRAVEAAERAGKVLTAFQNRRWDADFLTLQRLTGQGALGRIVHFESHFDRWQPVVPSRWKDAREGGSWLDLGPHLVDQALVLFGKPDAITADIAALRDGAPAPDWFHAVLHYPGMRAVLHSNKLAADHRLRFAVHGTAGSWIKHGLDTQEPAIIAGARPGDDGLGIDPEPGVLTSAENPDQREVVPNERGAYERFWRALGMALRGEGPNPVPAEQALDTMAVLEAGLESAAKGMTVRL